MSPPNPYPLLFFLSFSFSFWQTLGNSKVGLVSQFDLVYSHFCFPEQRANIMEDEGFYFILEL